MSTLSKLNLDDDFAEAIAEQGVERWHLERKGDLEVWVTLSPEEHSQELFTARLLWTTYPGDWPPSVVFVEPSTGGLGVLTAWPAGAGFRPTENDICATWTLEGYITHPEWKTDESKRLQITGNALLLIVRTLQHELDCHFTGRHQP